MSNYTYHLAADTATGIYMIDPADYPEADYQSYPDFYNSLDGLDDGEIIFTIVDPDQLEDLKKEYGIR